MPIQIGQTSPDFSNPTALMSDCHRRIEIFLSALQKVGEADDELTHESKRTLDRALRYFREAAPKHTKDEEESLFPRMRKRESAEMASVMAQMDRLERDHKKAQALHDEVEQLGERWLQQATINRAERQRFCAAVSELEEIYREHIELEDQKVFPLAARILSTEEQREVGLEMARRRSLPDMSVGISSNKFLR